jgi:hypothetical protein
MVDERLKLAPVNSLLTADQKWSHTLFPFYSHTMFTWILLSIHHIKMFLININLNELFLRKSVVSFELHVMFDNSQFLV